MSDRPAAPRRTCPACARRYAGVIAPDCPVCTGLGTLTLGAAALHHYDTAAVARAIDLYLEHHAQRIAATIPYPRRREALEAAVDDLRIAGVLASAADVSGTPAHTPTPADTAAARIVELDAHRAARTLGAPPTTAVLAALAAAPLTDLTRARPRTGQLPTASRMGIRTATATIADPIDPLGPDTDEITAHRGALDHRGAVIAAAVPTTARRRRTTR